MTTTADLGRESVTGVSDLRELDRSAVLDVVVSARRSADREEARLLAAAVQWVDLHPVTGEHPGAVFRDGTRRGPLGHGLIRGDAVPLAGPGTPGIAEYAVEELAAALDLSLVAGLHLVGEAVELCFRLPRLWALVQDGRLQAWKARQVARATTGLSRASVTFVDRHLAVTGRHNRIPALNPVLHEARLRCDPDQAAAVEQLALEHRGVWFDHRESTALTTMTARLDTLDALDLDGSLADLASTLGRLGDHRPLDLRRATAARPSPTRACPRSWRHRHRPRGWFRGDRPQRVTRDPLPARRRHPPRGPVPAWRVGGEARHSHPGTAPGLAAEVLRGHGPPGPRPGPHRHGGRPRRPGLDA